MSSFLARLPADIADTIAHNSLETVRPEMMAGSRERRALSALADLDERSKKSRRYSPLGEVLGEGAMGRVHQGMQPGLQRRVAVKILKDEHRSEAETLQLLQEAWVTSALEHPHIIPVYELALDESGAPLVVFKKVTGLSWGELMHAPPRIEGYLGEADALDWNLRVLQKIATALHFAHERGVVHRDVKPRNVMCGPFGEVYLMDWGIAVSTRPEDLGLIPLARDVDELAGTPGYMAPEMIAPGEPHVSPRTDVYLLGAVLFEILSGHAPHSGPDLGAIIASVRKSQPKSPSSAPPHLVEVCRRAMSADIDERYQSAEAFRAALDDFSKVRASARLCLEANDRLEAFERRIGTHGIGPRARTVPSKDRVAVGRLYDSFGACRFGFQQALREGPGNPVAVKGLERAVRWMALYELAHGNLSAAEMLVLELKDPPEDLAQQVADAQRKEQARLTEIQGVIRDQNPEVGSHFRALFALVIGTSFTVSPLMGWWAAIDARESMVWGTFASAAYLGLAGAVALLSKNAFQTRLNRGVLGAFALALIGQLFVHVGVFFTAMPDVYVFALRHLCWAAICSMLAFTLEPRLMPTAIVYALAFVTSAFRPSWGFAATFVANGTLTLNAMLLWYRPGLKKSPQA